MRLKFFSKFCFLLANKQTLYYNLGNAKKGNEEMQTIMKPDERLTSDTTGNESSPGVLQGRAFLSLVAHQLIVT